MIKISVRLLATLLVVACGLEQCIGRLLGVDWSRGIDPFYKNYHKDYQDCLASRGYHYPDRRHTEPHRGSNCHGNGVVDEIMDNDKELQEIWDAITVYRHDLGDGREPKGNPGPQYPGYLSRLEYDRDLARDAWRWARECTPGRDPCTLLPDTVGQTTVSVLTPKKDTYSTWDLFLMWYNEVEHFDKNDVCSYNPETEQKVGNFTQVAWSVTGKFGCAKSIDFNGTMYRTTLVCNYHPQGNKKGHRVWNALRPNGTYMCHIDDD